jgi:large subunit ribosomal protein L9
MIYAIILFGKVNFARALCAGFLFLPKTGPLVYSGHMKVIFIKDVPKMGRRLEVKDMPDGYARNFLIPKGLVVAATPAEMAKRDREVQSREDSKALEDKLVEANFEHAADETLVIRMIANEEGHLFSAVTPRIIREHLENDRHVDLPEKAIVIEHPIKTVGPHVIQLQFKDHKKILHILVEPVK